VVLACCALAAAGRAAAEDQPVPPADQVCATVDGQPIIRREVDRELARAIGDRTLTTAARDVLRRKTLAQLIDRRLVLRYLERNGLGASRQEIDRQLTRIGQRLSREDLELDEYLKRSELTLQELRLAAAWEIGWKRFLEKHLTDDNLAKYFAQHQRDWDGTELSVAHIVFPVDSPDDARALQIALTKAAEVRRRIAAGQVTFDDAARRHSSAASASDSGKIGRIGRRRPMPEAFSRAAFTLDKGQLSEPVVTAFGVHLIQCQEVHPGRRQWEDVRSELEQAVQRYLFSWAADQQRPHSTIQVTEGDDGTTG
jgi:parvulin-like peptidyl-prolyl isomerase